MKPKDFGLKSLNEMYLASNIKYQILGIGNSYMYAQPKFLYIYTVRCRAKIGLRAKIIKKVKKIFYTSVAIRHVRTLLYGMCYVYSAQNYTCWKKKYRH